MNKSGLIEALSKKMNLTEKKAIDVVNLVFKGFKENNLKSLKNFTRRLKENMMNMLMQIET